MERLTRNKAIRAKCLECCCGQSYEVNKCPIKDCPLWVYRLGHEIAPDGSSLPKKRKPRSKIDT